MAKVFATLVIDGKVTLKTWPSKAAFNKYESWLDDKFIYLATSTEFKGDWMVSPTFSEDCEVDGLVKLTSKEIEAHSLMVRARNEYLKIR